MGKGIILKKKNKFSVLKSVEIINLPHYVDERGDLTVIERQGVVSFNISRVFTVRASQGSVRGKHSHRKCSQFMVCVSGSIEVQCDDGAEKKTYLLDSPYIGLNVPPGIWAEEKYLKEDSILTVFCDRTYEENDYIRNYDDFKVLYATNNMENR